MHDADANPLCYYVQIKNDLFQHTFTGPLFKIPSIHKPNPVHLCKHRLEDHVEVFQLHSLDPFVSWTWRG